MSRHADRLQLRRSAPGNECAAAINNSPSRLQAFLLEGTQPTSDPAAGGANGHDADSDSSSWFTGWLHKRREGEQPSSGASDSRGRSAGHSMQQHHHHHSHAPSREHATAAAATGKPDGFAALLQDGRTMQRLQQNGPALPSLPDTLVCRVALCVCRIWRMRKAAVLLARMYRHCCSHALNTVQSRFRRAPTP